MVHGSRPGPRFTDDYDEVYRRELYGLEYGTPLRVPDRWNVNLGDIGVLQLGGFDPIFNAFSPDPGSSVDPLPRPSEDQIMIGKELNPDVYASRHFVKTEVTAGGGMYVTFYRRIII
jgi:hypothetical protein